LTHVHCQRETSEAEFTVFGQAAAPNDLPGTAHILLPASLAAPVAALLTTCRYKLVLQQAQLLQQILTILEMSSSRF